MAEKTYLEYLKRELERTRNKKNDTQQELAQLADRQIAAQNRLSVYNDFVDTLSDIIKEYEKEITKEQ